MTCIKFFLRVGFCVAAGIIVGTAAQAVYTFTGNVSVDDTFFTQNTLVNGFTINSGATVTWNTSGTVTGHMYIYSGGVLNISANNVLTINNTDAGTTGIDNAGNINVLSGAVLNINNGLESGNTTFGIANTGSVYIYGTMDVRGQGNYQSIGFYNLSSGSLLISGGSLGTDGVVHLLNSNGTGIENDGNAVMSMLYGANLYVSNSGASSIGIANSKNIAIQDSVLWIQNSAGYGLCNGNAFSGALVDVSSISHLSTPGKIIVANTGGTGIWNGVIAGAGNFLTGNYGGKIRVMYGAVLSLENSEGTGILNGCSDAIVVIGDGGGSGLSASMTINSSALALTSVGSVAFFSDGIAHYTQGTIAGNVTKNGLPYLINNITISDDGAYSPAGYLAGFYVADGATLTWTSQQTLSGEITIESGGKIFGNLTRNGLPYLLADRVIYDSATPIDYTKGFYIGGNAVVDWNCDTAKKPVAGPVWLESGVLNINNLTGIGLRLVGALSIGSGCTLNINNSAGVGMYSTGVINSMSGSTINIQNSGGVGCYNFNTVAMVSGTTNVKNSGGIGFFNRGVVTAAGSHLIKIQHTGLYGFYNSTSSSSLSCSNSAAINIINSRGYGLISKSPIHFLGSGGITTTHNGGRAFVDRST